MPQPSSLRVPEEAEEREATEGCTDSITRVVEHALPLALSYGRRPTFFTKQSNLVCCNHCLIIWCCAADRRKIRWGSRRWPVSTQSRSTIGSSTRGRGIGSHQRTCGSRSWRVLPVDLLGRRSTSIQAQLDPESRTTWDDNWPTQSVVRPGMWRDDLPGQNWQ